jgi:hypothetical protein
MQIWTDLTSWDESAFQKTLAMTTLESLNTKVVANLLSFLLVNHMASSNIRFNSYEFSKWTVLLNSSGQISNWNEISGLGQKMPEDQRGLITDFVDKLLSFSTPTHMHKSDSHSNGCGHPKTALLRSFSGQSEIGFVQQIRNSETVSEFGEDYNFKLLSCLFAYGDIMICTHDLIILTKTKGVITHVRWQSHSQ